MFLDHKRLRSESPVAGDDSAMTLFERVEHHTTRVEPAQENLVCESLLVATGEEAVQGFNVDDI